MKKAHLFLTIIFLISMPIGSSLAQDDDAAREAAQRELEEELKRQAEETKRTCEREKENALSGCLSGVGSILSSCQSDCSSRYPANAGDYNDCKRECTDDESAEARKCHDKDRSTRCD